MGFTIHRTGKYLSVREYAEANSMTIDGVRKAMKAKRLTGQVKINKRIYIPANAVIIDRRVKHGRYIGLRQFMREGTDIRKGEK